jgi:hypothetical protein
MKPDPACTHNYAPCPFCPPIPDPMTDFESYAEKVRAALAERRALAQAATSGRWRGYPDESPEFGVVADQPVTTFPVGVGHGMRSYDAAFIAANDPAHVLALLGSQERQVEAAVEGLRRHQRGRRDPDRCCECVLCTPNGRVIYRRFPCSDALAWSSVLTGIGATYGVTQTDDAHSRRHSTARTGDRGLSGTRVTPEGETGLTEPHSEPEHS